MRGLTATTVAAGVGVAVAVTRKRAHRRRDEPGRWLSVTVNTSPERIGGAQPLPEPLERLADRVEIRIRPAAGDWGTELSARPRESDPGSDALAEVRSALRQAKSIIETGEVLQADARPSAHPGPAGRLLRLADKASGGKGRL